MDDQYLDINKDNDTKFTEIEHHPSKNPTKAANDANRIAPTTWAVSSKEHDSKASGNSKWAFEQKNKKSVYSHLANKEKEVVLSKEIITESKGKKKSGLRIVFEPNLCAKSQSTFESLNTASNNNRNRLPVGDCSETTAPEVFSPIPSTSAGPSLSSNCPIIKNIPTNINRQSRFICKLCDRAFNHISSLNQHYITHSTERPFSCKDCKTNFKRKADFNKHNTLHTGERLFTCSECRKTFTTASSLSAHEKIHTGDKLYVCRTCGKGYNHSSSKNRHEKICEGLLKSDESN